MAGDEGRLKALGRVWAEQAAKLWLVTVASLQSAQARALLHRMRVALLFYLQLRKPTAKETTG